ncbi:MAG: hypothetical protein IPG35_17765 [Flavobacteriales bacterium]|nr:hypothetical protein [Flavobacteriales bacterium]
MTKEQAVILLGLAPGCTNEQVLRRYNELRTKVKLQSVDALRRGEQMDLSSQSARFAELQAAYVVVCPEVPLPDEWIVGSWGAWGPWKANKRERRRTIVAQGSPDPDAKPDESEHEIREPKKPVIESLKQRFLVTVNLTPAWILTVLFTWLVAVHIAAIVLFSGSDSTASEEVHSPDDYGSAERHQAEAESKEHPSLFYSPVYERVHMKTYGREVKSVKLVTTTGPHVERDMLIIDGPDGNINMNYVDTGLYIFHVEFQDGTKLEQPLYVWR